MQYREPIGGWQNQLDYKQEVLLLPNGRNLTRQALITLRMVLLGTPRKVMAKRCFVSVKAIEKRLSKLNDILYVPDQQYFSLQESMQHWGLCVFLLTKEDWFAESRELPTSTEN